MWSAGFLHFLKSLLCVCERERGGGEREGERENEREREKEISAGLSIFSWPYFWSETLWLLMILLRVDWQMSIFCWNLHHYLSVLPINEHYHPIVGWQLQHVLRRNKQLNEAHSNFTCHQSPRHDWLHSLMHKFMRLLHMMEYAWLKEVMDSRAAKNGHHLDCVRTFFKTTPSALLHSDLYTIPKLNTSLGTDQWLSLKI